MIVIQRILTRWSKKERGPLGREFRARLPHAYALPSELLALEATCVRHFIERAAWKEDYFPFGSGDAASEPNACRRLPLTCAIRLAQSQCGLRVLFVHRHCECGSPRRRQAGPMVIAPGTWGRVRFNGRFAGKVTSYVDQIVNVANHMQPNETMFTTSEPTATLDASVHLF